MRRIMCMLVAAGALTGLAVGLPIASGQAGSEAILAAPPAGYRDWRLIAVAHEEGKLNDLRAILGNDIAVKAAREGLPSYPDGSILARLAWGYDRLPESSEAFGHPQSFVSGPPKNGVQFMVKDSKKYASTGGWGFVQFNDGIPASAAVQGTCYSCHTVVEDRDFVFNRYAR